jgi:hypothetical protein
MFSVPDTSVREAGRAFGPVPDGLSTEAAAITLLILNES